MSMSLLMGVMFNLYTQRKATYAMRHSDRRTPPTFIFSNVCGIKTETAFRHTNEATRLRDRQWGHVAAWPILGVKNRPQKRDHF